LKRKQKKDGAIDKPNMRKIKGMINSKSKSSDLGMGAILINSRKIRSITKKLKNKK